MLQQFQQHIENHFSKLKEQKLLIAFSGGIDSVVLTHLLFSLDYRITLAHCNFKLRGKESNEDEKFCLKFADDLSIECFVQQFETEKYAKKQKLSIQMAARELRYRWFSELQESFQLEYLLTAHHADDNIETFFINLLRGTGIKGLTGIPAINGTIIRTLLPFTRIQIEEYAKKQKLSWREDSSNKDTKYLRNKIRHKLIPKLKDFDADFQSGILKTMQQLSEAENIINDQLDTLNREGVVLKTDNGLTINVPQLLKTNHAQSYLFYLLQPYGFTAWDDIKNLLNAQSGKYIDASNWRILKDRKQLILREKEQQTQVNILVTELDKTIKIGSRKLTLKIVQNLPEQISEHECYVDADKLKFPLTIRNWQEGDYFYPINGKGKKKLSKFLKDSKKTMFQKASQLLLCDAENNVIWVIEAREDDRFKVDLSSKNLLRFQLK